MAKETFQRTKPHVNVGRLPAGELLKLQQSLARAGVSAAGARQFSEGQVVGDPLDRLRLAAILNASLPQATAVGSHEITGALIKIN